MVTAATLLADGTAPTERALKEGKPRPPPLLHVGQGGKPHLVFTERTSSLLAVIPDPMPKALFDALVNVFHGV